MQRGASLFLTLSFTFALVLPLSASATDCSALPNTHPATAGELPGVSVGTCVPDGGTSLLMGGCSFNPYPVLESFKSGGNIHITPSSDTGNLQNGVNPALACRLAQFLQYAQTQGCPLKISSGYRSAQEQYNICGTGGKNCGTPGRSCHQYGLAVDLTGAARCVAWAKQLFSSTSAPGAVQFKIFWPISSDDGHTQCIENKVGACDSNTKPCDGSVRISPDLSVVPGPGNSLPFDNSIRSALGVPPPPPPAAPVAQPIQSTTATTPATTATGQTTSTATPPALGTLNTTTYPAGTCSPQTYCSQSDGNIYYRTTTCVDQKYQTCSNGCTGLICNASSTNASNAQLSGLLTPDSTNQTSGGNSNSNGTSTFDLIDFFANPSPIATDIGTATPIDVSQLNQDAGAGKASTLQPTGTGQPIQTAPQGSGGAYGPVPQQTFTSTDLANSPGTYIGQSSTFQIALANMKSTLIGILNSLQPFGGRVGALQTYGE